ncbi:Hypothetical_protein [Hexamita inflata]|uniref:Hypothetical_protein n=1 Tax=Hexamita inflata TaxID=28002 RepID=A0AA86PXR8_9EUKA|nr:Hypothetical protein HINF_LOCUS35601 [Hexamita inflata]
MKIQSALILRSSNLVLINQFLRLSRSMKSSWFRQSSLSCFQNYFSNIGGANNLQTSFILAVLILQQGQIRNALGSWIYLPLFQSYSSFFIVIPTCRFQFFSSGVQIQNLKQSQHLSYINMVSLVEVSSMVLQDMNFNLRQFELWNKQICLKSDQ